MSEPNKMSKKQYEMLKAAAKRSIKRKNQVKSAKALKSLMDAEAANKDNEKRRGFKPSGFPMYRKGGKTPVKSGRVARTEANLREELKKKTSGSPKPAVKIKDTPMERIANTGAKAKVYEEMSDELVNKAGTSRMKANQLAMATIDMTYPAKIKKIGKEAGAKTYGQLADSVEKKYKFGGKIYKDGGLALFKALKKKFGEG